MALSYRERHEFGECSENRNRARSRRCGKSGRVWRLNPEVWWGALSADSSDDVSYEKDSSDDVSSESESGGDGDGATTLVGGSSSSSDAGESVSI